MPDPFVGEVRLVAFTFAPRGWSFCDGAILPINVNTALFSLLGTTYGGNGRTTFGLPDLRGRCAIHEGRGPGLSNHVLGSKRGTEKVTLTQFEVPTAGGGAAPPPPPPKPAPARGLLNVLDTNRDGTLSPQELRQAGAKFKELDANKDGRIDRSEIIGTPKRGRSPSPVSHLDPAEGFIATRNKKEVEAAAAALAHANMSPFLTLNFIIARVGIYPSRS